MQSSALPHLLLQTHEFLSPSWPLPNQAWVLLKTK